MSEAMLHRFPMTNPILGHHRIGDRLWYTAFERSNPLDLFKPDGTLKEGTEFKTHDAFLGLVTLLHESTHFIQDHTLGICAWVQLNADENAIAVHASQGLKPESNRGSDSSPEMVDNSFANRIHGRHQEGHFLQEIIYSSRTLDRVLEAESRAHPSIADRLEISFGLTGQELFECHAAILTERRIAHLMLHYKDAFSKSVVNDLAPYFRPERMTSCQRVIHTFKKYVEAIRFDTANRQHQLYPHCPRAAEFGLLLFLLDLALHTCPLPEGDEFNNGSALQDVVPAVRFLKLAGSVMPCIMEHRNEFNLNELYLHTEFMGLIVNHINYCNRLASGPSSGTSFLRHDEVSRRWIQLFEELLKLAMLTGVRDLFEIFHRARIKGMELLLKDPLRVYRAHFLSIGMDLGLHPMFSTKERVELAAPLFITAEKTKEGRTAYTIPASPHSVMDTHLGRLIFIGLSESVWSGTEFCCPVATQYAFYPCPLRSGSCESIPHSSEIPQCFARQVWSDFYKTRRF